MTNCLYPNCKIETYCRGLCLRHYQLASSLVKRKKITWESLVINGKALATRTQKKSSSWFLEENGAKP